MARRKTRFTCWRLCLYRVIYTKITQIFIHRFQERDVTRLQEDQDSVEIASVGAFLSVQTGAKSSNREKHRKKKQILSCFIPWKKIWCTLDKHSSSTPTLVPELSTVSHQGSYERREGHYIMEFCVVTRIWCQLYCSLWETRQQEDLNPTYCWDL